MFAAAKDAMASKAAQSYLNNLIARYGIVQELKIDSRAKTLSAVCLLTGERTPISVRADRYVIERVGDNPSFESNLVTVIGRGSKICFRILRKIAASSCPHGPPLRSKTTIPGSNGSAHLRARIWVGLLTETKKIAWPKNRRLQRKLSLSVRFNTGAFPPRSGQSGHEN